MQRGDTWLTLIRVDLDEGRWGTPLNDLRLRRRTRARTLSASR